MLNAFQAQSEIPKRKVSVSSENRSSRPKTLSTAGTSSGESDEESDSDIEIEEAPPLPKSRPTDPVKAAEYDVIKAVWHSRSTYIKDELLATRVAQFSELFFKLRDRWKVSNEALKQATESKQAEQASSLKSKVKQNRGIVEMAIKAAVQYGHPHILEM